MVYYVWGVIVDPIASVFRGFIVSVFESLPPTRGHLSKRESNVSISVGSRVLYVLTEEGGVRVTDGSVGTGFSSLSAVLNGV